MLNYCDKAKQLYYKDVIMPKLGAEITTGRIEEWKKKEGEWVEEKDKVCHFF